MDRQIHIESREYIVPLSMRGHPRIHIIVTAKTKPCKTLEPGRPLADVKAQAAQTHQAKIPRAELLEVWRVEAWGQVALLGMYFRLLAFRVYDFSCTDCQNRFACIYVCMYMYLFLLTFEKNGVVGCGCQAQCTCLVQPQCRISNYQPNGSCTHLLLTRWGLDIPSTQSLANEAGSGEGKACT